MPELPEVETSVQAIQEFANQNIESIEIYNPNLRWKVDCNAFKNLSGLKVSKIDQKSKIYTLPSKSITNTHSFRDDRNT